VREFVKSFHDASEHLRLDDGFDFLHGFYRLLSGRGSRRIS
jgi:hypothetical protein